MTLNSLRKLLPSYYRKRAARRKLMKYLDDYLEFKADLSPRTITNYTYYLTRFIRGYPNWPPTKADIAGYLDDCEAQGLSPTSVRINYDILKGFMNWCYETERIDRNPFDRLKPPKIPAPVSRSADRQSVAKFFTYLETCASRAIEDGVTWRNWRGIRDLAMFSFMYDTGCRIRETSYIQLKDVDLEAGLVYIREAKGGRPRYVAIGKNTKGDLKLLINSRSAVDVPKTCPYLFVRKRDGWGRMETQGIRRRLRRLCEELKIPYFKPHQLRHSYALQSLRNGASLPDVSHQLGHTKPSTTDRYIIAPETDRAEIHLASSPRDH